MVRQHSTILALFLTGVMAIGVPVSAKANVISAQNVPIWHISSHGDFAQSRDGNPSISDVAYIVTYSSGGTRKQQTFTTLNQAKAFASGVTDAVVVDGKFGSVVYSNIRRPYAVVPQQSVFSAGSFLKSSTYSSIQAAIAAAKNIPGQVVFNRISRAVVWSDGNNYEVIGQGATTSYQTLEAAMTAARGMQSAAVVSIDTQQTLWKAAYRVLIDQQFAESFSSFANAKAYATQNPQSEVIDIANGQDVWDNIPRFNVYQNGVLLKQFSKKSDALAFAKGLNNVTVEEIATQTVIYTNVPAYAVEVGNKTIQSFVDEASAIALAKTLPGSVVVQLSTNHIVWTSAATYGVYQYLQLVRSFNNEADAIAYAQTLQDVQVIDSANNQIVYSNYPTDVKSPYGDTFTVQNGMVVDNWGSISIPLAPAPSFMTPGQTYVSNDYDHWYEVLPTGDVYVGQWENPYQTMNLETQSTLTAAQINNFIAQNAAPNSVLQNTGQYFIEAQNTYGVNAQYLVAHAIIESAWGTSYFAMNRDNLFGYMAYTNNPDAAATFRSIEYDINFQAWFVRNSYLNANGAFFNGPNLDGMNVDYATDPYWANSIARIMSEIQPYSSSIGDQSLLGEQATRKVFPYPKGAMGQATSDLTVYSAPDDATTAQPTVLGTIPSGTDFPVLGDSPGWDQVQLPNGQVGFVNWNGVSLQNVMEVVGIDYGSFLAVNSVDNPTTTADTIDKLTNGVYVVLIQSSSDGWDEIMDGNGIEGWVSAKYVQVIH
ncbi:glucosaminidase domain-containing protein [Sulfoacidibacillus thermotolerans]|uniref:SH3b domain-containing protein n=1 Tax=Sulfoacidibacillus thermotolerans TaxID=1765684 RepID=A0A2U3DA59_SULT2|nr:glucosaminidase domain-containing protein [Sulfoacidibacillus thermotolerans]PWI58166.1 hypothetical protein BM613_04310 [Sulfoacidibacillus thermotolerans]